MSICMFERIIMDDGGTRGEAHLRDVFAHRAVGLETD